MDFFFKYVLQVILVFNFGKYCHSLLNHWHIFFHYKYIHVYYRKLGHFRKTISNWWACKLFQCFTVINKAIMTVYAHMLVLSIIDWEVAFQVFLRAWFKIFSGYSFIYFCFLFYSNSFFDTFYFSFTIGIYISFRYTT